MTALVVVVVVAGLGVLADRLAAVTAANALARALRDAERLETLPSVRIRGAFLPQVVAGSFRSVDVGLTGLRRDGLRVHRVDLTLSGVQFPPQALLAAVRGRGLETLTVDHVALRLLVTHADVSAMLRRRGLRVEAGPGDRLAVRVLNPFPVVGNLPALGADSSLRVEGGTHLVVRAERFLVGSGIANAVVSAAIGGRFDFRLEVGPLPVPVSGCEVTAQGLVLRGAGEHVVLDTG